MMALFSIGLYRFMAQTAPDRTGMWSGTNLDAEFTDYEYRVGTVGMVGHRAQTVATVSFSICFDGCTPTGQYTVWTGRKW